MIKPVKPNSQSGFITLIVVMVLVLATAVYLAYKHVSG